jgi:Mg-chelatase subunit ChlD
MTVLMRSGLVMFVGIALAICNVAGAQVQSTAQSEPVTYQEVVKLLRTGKSDQEILDTLSKSRIDVNFVLGESQIQELRKMRVSDEFIEALKKLKNQPSSPGADVTDFALILDCSGSMMEKTKDGTSKMEAAKKSVAELIQKVPNGMRICFIIYGHDKQLECKAVKVVRPLSELDDAGRSELMTFIAGLKPSGHTPIAAALQVAGKEMAGSDGLAEVALITDGIETCHGDPAKEAADLANNLKLKSGVNVIGFDLKPQEREAVEKIAQAGRGKYYDAQTVAQLRDSISKVTRIKLETTEPAKPADDGRVPPVVLALMEQLSDEAADVRFAAAESLGKMGPRAKGAVPALMSRIADDLWGGQAEGAIGNKDNAPGNNSKDAALRTLKELAPEKVDEALLAALKAESSKTKEWAATQLASVGAGEKSKGKRPGKSKPSTEAGPRNTPAVVQALIEQLNDEHADVRWAAAQSLGKLGASAKDAVPALMKRIADDVWGGQADGAIGNKDNSSSGNTSKDAAVSALKELAPDKVEEALLEALKAENNKTKSWAAKQLGQVQDGSKSKRSDGAAVNQLIEQLTNENARVREDALESLKKLAPDKVEAGLTAALKSKNAKVRAWAAEELANQK